MKKLTLLVLSCVAIVTLAACGSGDSKKSADSGTNDKLAQIKDKGKLVIGTSPDFPPYEFYILNDKNEKEIVGSDIALAKAVADEIGVELEIKATDFNGVLANIQTNSVDLGISGFVATEQREGIMDFSEGYQQEVNNGFQGILVPKEIAEKYQTLDDLKAANLTIGAQGGSIQFETASTLTDAKNIKQFGTMDAAVLALNSGDIQAVTVSTSSVEPLLTTFPDLVILPKETFNLDPENKYGTNVIGFPKGDDTESLITVVNEVIKENNDNGNLAKWREESEEQAVNALKE
ncbi:polar amino acid transport system substrate-binding protein [Enterococcus sp. DIV2402]|uniref:Polar amino acid transport system substrate-binding protein n=1 Tax=Candidatus Enterococcus lowellii TaxID=2230877 RepID=A0ABZ2SM67_9ENTE|nr:transporter substrate-binding domain-containing protein [Enterococcus sp. DIV2402]MBO0463062.1 transporter substrate-binding domain-containing protein [Enterococcus sp. DIV2402]